MNVSLIVDRSMIKVAEWFSSAQQSLQKGQIRISVEKFALTSNNITYGVVGDVVGYWKFFPVLKEGMGIIPTWGYGKVIESRNDKIEEGSTFYGFYPMSKEIIMNPIKIGTHGFVDGKEHRSGLPRVYNAYTDIASDSSFNEENLAFHAIFRPLFVTGFLLDDYLGEQSFFGAEQLIITSASSKTALALSHQCALNHPEMNVLGLTSTKNVDFCDKHGHYDKVYSYEEADRVPRNPSVIVDFAGNAQLLIELDQALGSNLKFCSKVGMVHYDHYDPTLDLGEKARFFFAPSQARKRSEEWGRTVLHEKINTALLIFIQSVSQWVHIEEISEKDQFLDIYSQMAVGRVDPKIGYIVNYSMIS